MPNKYQEMTVAFSRRLLADCLPVPATLLRNYRAWGLDETTLIMLLRIIKPLLNEGVVSAAQAAAEFQVPEQDVPLLLHPLTDIQMLVEQEGNYYGDGLLRDIFQFWLDEQRGDEPQPRSRRRRNSVAEERENIRQLARLYRRFEADLGRNLGQSENEQLRSWLNDDNISPELIEEALKRAKLHDKTSFAYIASILADWRAKGLDNLAAIQQLDSKPRPGAKRQPTATAKKAGKGEFDFVFQDNNK